MPNNRTHFSDGITQGHLEGNLATLRLGPDVAYWTFVPATLDQDGIAAAQQLGAAGNLTLNGALVNATSGEAVIDSADATISRRVSLTSAGNLSAITFTLYGYDVHGEQVVENVTGPNANTVNSLKAFKRVVRVAASAAVGTNVEVGTIDAFGLPFRLVDAGALLQVKWDSTLAANAATVTAAVATDPATATTGDVRGIVVFAGNAANGTRRAHILQAVDLTSRTTQFGVRQYGKGLF